MSTTKITERHLNEKFLQNLYTKDNPPTASDVGAVAESDLATAIQSLIDSGVIEAGGFKSPIKMTSYTAGSSAGTFSGTGKGELYIQNEGGSPVVIIDGIKLGTPSGTSDNGYIRIPFSESFIVEYNAYNSNGTALFY